MLSLLDQLQDLFAPLAIFGFVSSRVVFAAVTAFLLMMFGMPPFIAWLRRKRFGEQGGKGEGAILVDQMRQAKAGTPTMGGLGLIACLVTSALLWCRPDAGYTWLLIVTVCAFGVLGFIDDRTKIFRGAIGLPKRHKIVLQVLVGLLIGWWLWSLDQAAQISLAHEIRNGVAVATVAERIAIPHHLTLPFVGLDAALPLGIGLIGWVLVMTFACANSVNFTDGMDGLAGGTMLIASLAFMVIAYLTSNFVTAAQLDIFYVRGAEEVAVFCAATAGACLGFLWFNCAPAEVFMGDTGSQALGGVLAVIATCVHQEFLLLLVGFVFFMEGASVALQVASYRLRGGKRIFLCAPIHHHFQYKGWDETKIVQRFWIIAALAALLALATLKIR